MKTLFYLAVIFLHLGVAAVDGKTQNYRSPGKPQAPIELDYQPITKPLVAGQRAQLELRFKVAQEVEQLSVETSERTDQAVLQKASVKHLKVAQNGLSEAMSVGISVPKNGIYYISVIATTDTAGQKLSRTFAIPVIVGKADWDAYLKPDGELTKDHNGRRILVQPAHETIQD